mmetsp:Transcript_65709/g.137352  ORF Transcript_65709/g.137352 Transcript_65709/m.137352 type:complete len:571 (+) Transcript_65709:208-1920(+)|eukprot:CAMPEP_0206424722 /NCGR_PEP_ID=MMETSP0324_2-20121206/3393_1 /ASSEMBLY_ACC=CAM_ASM_000836 /TAXON_ID=2866 /ORGANISM="Crypthecodinium cohnii, Strain Seligo" /LENGTH=570 /DNA_ID=CAMNT_0053889423 /DNA_START=161 /DNA_END=1873 /DNA_ORIENTATION=-
MEALDPAGTLRTALGVLEEREEYVVVVDPYSSGRFLVDELRKRGWPLLAVRSSLAIDEALLSTWNPASFEASFVHVQGHLEDTLAKLKHLHRPIRAVLAGSEPGVELTDELASALGLRGNDPSRPRPNCRWDKYEMHEQLAASGIRALKQRRCESPQEAASFAAELKSWPIVVKPKTSHGGGGGVHLCGDETALREAVAFVRSSKDFSGASHDVALVQEYLEGREFVVDCVSLDGEHCVTATWAYRKTPTDCGFVYDHTRTMPYSDEPASVQQRLYRYVFKCLTALGVQNGPSHTEVIIPEGDQESPCLVRLGTRLHSAMGPALWSLCTNKTEAQPFLVVETYTEADGGIMKRHLSEIKAGSKSPYTLKKWALQVDLQCPVGGILTMSIEYVSGEWLRALPTFASMRTFVEEGDRVTPTKSLSTSPGFVVLVGDTEAEVDADLLKIRNRENSGAMYVVKEASPGHTSAPARRNSISAARIRELEAEAEKLISPLASRAASPVLSPRQPPAMPPVGEGAFVEFTLDGEGLDDLGFDLDDSFDPLQTPCDRMIFPGEGPDVNVNSNDVNGLF